MNRFYFYITLITLISSTLFSSCSDDEEYASILLSQQAVFFSTIGESRTISYTGSNVASLEATNVPDGWQININRAKLSIEVVGPTTWEEFETSKEYTIIVFTATSHDDNCGYDYMTVGTTSLVEDISSQQSNSFIVTQANTIYTFNGLVKGEDQGSISPSYAAILWQSSSSPVTSSRLTDDGLIEFHVALDNSDIDNDESYTDIVEGNTVIAAFDSSDNVLWTWHIWVTESSPEDSTVELNGATLMERNLGAATNNTQTTATILSSYGLYYQWGRKDPFTGPFYYNAAGSSDNTLYDESGSYTYVSYEESTSSVGKESYAIKYPMTYILGVENSSYDWLYSAHSSQLWTEEKTINDPCPKGWRVASSSAFDNLKVPTLTAEELASLSDKYGWTMSDAAGNSALMMGLGRRSYITGVIQNINANETRPAPWAGYYWSLDTADSQLSTALFFTYDNEELAGNQSMLANYYRANGMQVRCQKL